MSLLNYDAMILAPSFFNRPTLRVARELLGCTLCRRFHGRITRGVITETEAYCGPNDLASHASRGKTARNAVMFGPPGQTYIYLVYGMHWCLNVVTERAGYPAAVLIRAVAVPGMPYPRTNGPGKLCRVFHLDGRRNGQRLDRSLGLWIECAPRTLPRARIRRTSRIGVNSAGDFRHKPWRFVLISS